MLQEDWRYDREAQSSSQLGLQGVRYRSLEPGDGKAWLVGSGGCYQETPGVSLPIWQFNKGLAIDVAVICPVAPSHMGEQEPAKPTPTLTSMLGTMRVLLALVTILRPWFLRRVVPSTRKA